MPNIYWILASAAAGAITAFITVFWLNKSVEMLKNKKSSLLIILGFPGRLFLCAACFIAVSYGGHLDRLIACLTGFALTYTAAVVITRNSMVKSNKGVIHDNQPGQN